MRFPGPTHRNIYVSSEAAAQRVYEAISQWISEHLRLQVNAAKSGVGRCWERKFLGFRITPAYLIEIAPESWERLKERVRQYWNARQAGTSTELRDRWNRYLAGWWNYPYSFSKGESLR